MSGFLIVLAIFAIISLIIPWFHLSNIRDLERDVADLKNQMAKLLAGESKINNDSFAEEPLIQKKAEKPNQISSFGNLKIADSSEDNFDVKNKPIESKPKISFEQRFGARLPVWIGGAALALAGIFMVKYSIETGILTEKARTLIGGLFGLVLLYVARKIYSCESISNKDKISQAIIGAAIIDLYACFYTASTIYDLISPVAGFIGMTLVTILAIFLSLKYGYAVAIFGLIGGFLTPALVSSSEPNGIILFAYLYLIFAGIFFIIRKKNWWKLSILVVLAALLWVTIWLMGGHFVPADTVFLGLFLVAICATVVISSKDFIETKIDESGSIKISSLLSYITIGGSVLLMGTIAAKGGLGSMQWGFFGLIAIGSVILAYANQKVYGFAPIVTATMSVILFLAWKNYEPINFTITLVSFMLLYVAGGYYLMFKSQDPKPWAILASASSFVYYVIGYYELNLELKNYLENNPENIISGLPIWGIVAMLFALFGVQIAKKVNVIFANPEETRQKLLAIFAFTSTAFISIAFISELKTEFWMIFFSLQILVTSIINKETNIKALHAISKILILIFVLSAIPQILLIFGVAFNSIILAGSRNLMNITTAINNPLLYFGIPALSFGIASWIFSLKKEEDLVKFSEFIAVILFTITSYYLVRNIFNPDVDILSVKAGFIERGVITNIFFLYGVLCLFISQKINHKALSLIGMQLFVIGILRIIYFDLLIQNPLFARQYVGSMPIFNALILPYGFPIAALVFMHKQLKDQFYLKCNGILTLVLMLTFFSLNVRQFYHGGYLHSGITTDAETYTYSIVWLLLGVTLLFLGTIRKNKMIRIASLSLIILTVFKVFLYDAAELTGLYRVFSFLILGVILIALSWFYNRFIHEEKSGLDPK